MSFLSQLATGHTGYYDDTAFTGNNIDTDAGTIIGVFLISIFFGLVVYLIAAFLFYKVFKKAGRPGWAGFVPFYNLWVFFEISGKPGWWSLSLVLSAIPIIGFVFSIAYLVLSLLACLELAKRFSKGPVFGVIALWLFSIVGFAILAFDSSKYRNTPLSTTQTPPSPPPAPTPAQ